MWPVSEEGAARADRVQRAREAFHDTYGEITEAINAALDTATRVQLTREVFDAFFAKGPTGDPDNPNWREPLARAFRAAGFEVEE
jgi:hypothetical protein